jgi:hypothetical protein
MIMLDELQAHAVARYQSLLDEAEAERRAREARPVAPRCKVLDPIRVLVVLIMAMSRQ